MSSPVVVVMLSSAELSSVPSAGSMQVESSGVRSGQPKSAHHWQIGHVRLIVPSSLEGTAALSHCRCDSRCSVLAFCRFWVLLSAIRAFLSSCHGFLQHDLELVQQGRKVCRVHTALLVALQRFGHSAEELLPGILHGSRMEAVVGVHCWVLGTGKPTRPVAGMCHGAGQD